MKRILFASDLDNTLIFSYKHCHPGWNGLTAGNRAL